MTTEQNKQHGYLPKKGLVTAWIALASKLNQPNIYEADFRQFFPSVTLPGVRVALLKSGFPLKEALFIEAINSSQPKLPAQRKLDESQVLKAQTFNAKRISTGSNPDLSPLMYTIGKHKDWAFEAQSEYKGLPQGAPTSCSLATWVLRSIEHLDVVLYADDVIYFPKTSDCNPIEDLSLPKWGIQVHPEKSR